MDDRGEGLLRTPERYLTEGVRASPAGLPLSAPLSPSGLCLSVLGVSTQSHGSPPNTFPHLQTEVQGTPSSERSQRGFRENCLWSSGLQLCVVKSAPGPVTSPWPVDRSAPPWLLPPSAPPATIVLTAPLGSAVPVPPAPPWSDVTLPALDLWAFSYTSSLHPSDSTISLAPLGPLAPWLHLVHKNKAKRSAKPNFIITFFY